MSSETGWALYSTNQEYQAGETIFKEGDLGDHAYVISSGRVAIILNAQTEARMVLTHLGAGELMGEISLFRNEHRTASAVAVEPVVLMSFSRDNFWRLFDEDWAFRHLVMNSLVKNLVTADHSRVAAAATERALSELMELRQETTRFIIHDLRNPLNVMTMALVLIENDPSYSPNSEIAQYVADARSGINRMLVMIESMLDAERMHSGAFTLDTAIVDVVDLIDEIMTREQTIAQSKGIVLDMELPIEPPPFVIVDRLRIDRVLTNLIDNALKFTPAGKRIWTDIRTEPGLVIIGVNDSGPGIPPEQRASVFERFVQSESGRSTRRGFGLGLAYCQSAIQAHGGKIWVEDGYDGVGVRFVFTLPAKTSVG
jgi:signal transduction histidine kinase